MKQQIINYKINIHAMIAEIKDKIQIDRLANILQTLIIIGDKT